jgi:hypothetical protein
MILQQMFWYAELQDESLDWLVGLVFLLGWIEVEAPSHSFPANFEPKSDKFLAVYFATTGYYNVITISNR